MLGGWFFREVGLPFSTHLGEGCQNSSAHIVAPKKIETSFATILAGLYFPNLFYLFRVCYTCFRICQVLTRLTRKLFAMLANHSQICENRPHRCAVFNPWEPLACLKHHELIEMWSPSCSRVMPIPGAENFCFRWIPGGLSNFYPRNGESMKNLVEISGNWRNLMYFSLDFHVLFLAPFQLALRIPRRRSKVLKVGRDWLGISHDCSKGTPQNQPELTRRFECWGLPWGPLPGVPWDDVTWMGSLR